MTWTWEVTLTTPGTADSNFLLWSAGLARWLSATTDSQVNSNTVRYIAQGSTADCTRGVLLADPAAVTSTAPFTLGTPLSPITATPAAPARLYFVHRSGFSFSAIWTQPVTWNGMTNNDPNLLGWSTGLAQWIPLQLFSQISPNRIGLTNDQGRTDISTVVELADPLNLTSAMGFTGSATPLNPIT